MVRRSRANDIDNNDNCLGVPLVESLTSDTFAPPKKAQLQLPHAHRLPLWRPLVLAIPILLLIGITRSLAHGNFKFVDFHSPVSLGKLTCGRIDQTGDFAKSGSMGEACGKVTVPVDVQLKLEANFYATAHLPLLAQLQDPNLVALDLSNDGRGFELNDDKMQLLGQLTNLHFLDIQMCEAGSKTMKAICNLRNLNFLDLSASNFTPADAVGMRSLSELRSLAINHNKLTDDSFAFLESMPELTTLEVIHCGMTAKGVKHLKNLHKLKNLKASSNHLGDEGLKNLPLMPDLKEVALNECDLTSRAVPLLKRFPKLAIVYLDGITASKETLTDLTQLPALYSLSIGGHSPPVKLTDLVILRRCKHLTRLYVTVSAQDKVKIKRLLPGVEVIPSAGPRNRELFEPTD